MYSHYNVYSHVDAHYAYTYTVLKIEISNAYFTMPIYVPTVIFILYYINTSSFLMRRCY